MLSVICFSVGLGEDFRGVGLSSSGKPGYQEGGWVLIELEPQQEDAEFVRFELRYKVEANGPDVIIRRDVSLREAMSHAKDGAVWGSDEGMIHATVLKEFVDIVKETLADKKATQFPASLKQFLLDMQTKHSLDLQKQLTQIDELTPKLAL